jgi:hypothetical protein
VRIEPQVVGGVVERGVVLEMPPSWSTAQLREAVASVGRLARAGSDAERIDRIRLLEGLKAAAAAAQAVETAAFADSQQRRQRDSGTPAASVGTGVAAQVGLAKRESPGGRRATWAGRGC